MESQMTPEQNGRIKEIFENLRENGHLNVRQSV